MKTSRKQTDAVSAGEKIAAYLLSIHPHNVPKIKWVLASPLLKKKFLGEAAPIVQEFITPLERQVESLTQQLEFLKFVTENEQCQCAPCKEYRRRNMEVTP